MNHLTKVAENLGLNHNKMFFTQSKPPEFAIGF